MAPILARLKQEYAGKFEVELIDVWKDESAGKKYGVEIIPTQIFFDAQGKELFRHSGFFGREDVLGKWVSAGCFKQGFFVEQENLKKWLTARPAMTGRQITIAQALADKMKLTPQQIAKACKLGECL